MYSKKQRHVKILEIVEKHAIEKQEEIVARLRDAGCRVTQATVSRDIHDLRLVKTERDGVQAYKPASAAWDGGFNEKLGGIFANSVLSVAAAGNIVVVKTIGGAAAAAASAIDSMGLREIAGSIAGDDTVMAVTHSVADAVYICARLNEMRG
ncbi:MAG: arginine repressor [Clostridiales bacterium]|jgi:transcriptional regulator of arginine metabolism|nr:arginine repressor [Clostridiales bacterium]